VADRGLVVGALDFLDAVVFFGLRSGTTPVRIGQSIAAGLQGRAAFSGGLPSAALGVLLHFFIAFTIVFVCYFLSRAIPGLVEHPIVSAGSAVNVITRRDRSRARRPDVRRHHAAPTVGAPSPASARRVSPAGTPVWRRWSSAVLDSRGPLQLSSGQKKGHHRFR